MSLKKGVFCVENTDAHIAEEDLKNIFMPFYRVEQSRSRNSGGSGLGLYLVRIILEQHRANCRIENTEDGVQATVSFNPPK